MSNGDDHLEEKYTWVEWQCRDLPPGFERSLRMIRLEQHIVPIAPDQEIKFRVDHVRRTLYDDEESRMFVGKDFEPLMRAYCVRNGMLSHAPGTNEEVVAEIVEQLKLERSLEWVLLYYLKALDRLMGCTPNADAVDAVVEALGDMKKHHNQNPPEPDEKRSSERFWAQFDALAEKMIAAHDKPETTHDGKVKPPKRWREEFEADASKRGCDIQL